MISIIIPVYNHQKELEKCLQSIEKQTYKDYEIIVVDDGSSPAIVFEIQNPKSKACPEQSRGIQNFRINHSGASAARNFGFKNSGGEYLLFCDADIEMKPKMLEMMIKALEENPSSSYAYSSYKYGFKKFRLFPFSSAILKKVNYIHTTSLIRREVFPGFDESLKRFQDWDIWLTMLENGHTGVWLPEILFKIHTKSGTMSKWLPKAAYALADKLGIRLKRVKEYEKAREVILKKHHL